MVLLILNYWFISRGLTGMVTTLIKLTLKVLNMHMDELIRSLFTISIGHIPDDHKKYTRINFDNLRLAYIRCLFEGLDFVS